MSPAKLLRRTMYAENGCLLWTGPQNGNGYGATHYAGRRTTAHRAFYEMLVGPIPTGLVLDHLCRQRECVNPAHLEPVTHAENLRRGAGWSGRHAQQTHCVNGHEFTPENTRDRMRPGGGRACRQCSRDQTVARRHQRPPRPCDTCGSPVEQAPVGRTKRYCDPACRRRASR